MNRRSIGSLVLVVAMLSTACTSNEGSQVDTHTAAASESTAISPPPAAPSLTDWTVTPKGIGRITAGMTLDAAKRLYGDDLIVPPTVAECDWVRIRNAPPRLLIMVEQGRVSRVDVDSGTAIATAGGARIGDTEDRVKSLYPDQVTVQPHKYTDGHYLVVRPAEAALRDFRIVFETDGKTVTRFRSGRIPAVEYVEGCS